MAPIRNPVTGSLFTIETNSVEICAFFLSTSKIASHFGENTQRISFLCRSVEQNIKLES